MTPKLLADLARVFRREADAIYRDAVSRHPWVMSDDERALNAYYEDVADNLMCRTYDDEP